MPCKYHPCIAFDESNILVVDISLSRAVKITIFALARVASYTLVPTGKFNTDPMPVSALCQLDTHTKLFMECFLKIEVEVPFQPPRG